MMAMMDDSPTHAADIFTEMLRMQGEAARQMVGTFVPEMSEAVPSDAEITEWGESALKLQRMWLEFCEQQAIPEAPVPLLADPAQWMGLMQAWYRQVPLLDPEFHARLAEEGMELWEDVLAQYGLGPKAGEDRSPEIELPRSDRRFADRSEEHTSELQSRENLVCRLL